METVSSRIAKFTAAIGSGWSVLNTVFNWLALVTSFTLPAWAVSSLNLFSQHGALSWVVAGFAGMGTWAIIRVVWHWASILQVRASYDARMLSHGSIVNPLDTTFEKKRILINDFCLPSHPFIEGKTFIDCDLIGPANIYFHESNLAHPIKAPPIDAVWLAPRAEFRNGFIFNNCLFRNCSFQRITIFASVENYEKWKDNPNINWIGIKPDAGDLQDRQQHLDSFNPRQIEDRRQG
jgi:hypothetical protein